MLVKDVMTMSPVAVTPSDSISFAAKRMQEWDIGLLPVVESQYHKRLLGVITDRDIVTRCIAGGQSSFCRVSDHLTPTPVTTVYPETSVDDAMLAMRTSRVRRLPVVDEHEVVVGMLTQADLARHLADRDAKALARLIEEVSQPTADVP